MSIIFPLFYFPPISYFSLWSGGERCIVEAHENFQKQTHRNRAFIPGPNNQSRLVVPVRSGRKGLPYHDMLIDESVNWRLVHWRTIQAAYGRSPFFEHYETFIKGLIFFETDKLWNLNLNILTNCLEELGLQGFELTREYDRESSSIDFDYRNAFDSRDSGHFPSFFKPVEYYQIFGKPFVSNMSIIDLVFCEGPNAREIIQSSLVI